jgi:hypothetical protein
MDGLLNFGIDSNHFLVQLRMISDHYLRIPTSCNKDSVDTTANRGCKYVSDLKANQKCISHDNSSKSSVTVVRRIGFEEIEVGKESACVANEDGTEGKHGANKAVLVVIVSKVQDKRN